MKPFNFQQVYFFQKDGKTMRITISANKEVQFDGDLIGTFECGTETFIISNT